MKIRNKLVFLIGILCSLNTISVRAASPLKINVSGVDNIIEESIKEELKLSFESWSHLSPETREARLIEVKQRIAHTLEPYGYYSSNINLSYAVQPQHEILKINIELGPPVKISSFHWSISGSGEFEKDLNELFNTFPLSPGKILNHAMYEKMKREILATAYFAGYVKARFTQHDIYVDLKKHEAEIHLHLDTDQLYKFGNITFTDDYFSQYYLNRYVTFKPGDHFSPDALLTLQRQLTLSDQFSSIFIHQIPVETDPEIPIKIQTQRAKPNKYTFGVGYGTDTGARGQAGWERRWINRHGHRLLMQGSLSEVYNQGYIEYIIPGKNPIFDQITFSVNGVEDEFSENESRYWQWGLSEKKRLSEWERTFSLYYRTEHFSEFKDTSEKKEKLLLPSVELSRSKKDNVTNPTSGYFFNIKLIGSIDTLISDASFAQLTAKFNWLKTFSNQHALLIRSEWGFTAPDDISKLPLSMRFYAGGDNSLRGFGYRTLPINRNDSSQKVSVGGAYKAVGTFEWSYKIRHPFGISTFIDFGNAFLNRHDPIEVGAGVGARWHTPIGALKIDLAKPLTRGGNGWRIHVTFGTGL